METKIATHTHLYWSPRHVLPRVVYCHTALSKLETQGHFPRRVQITPTRAVWAAGDILAWMQNAIDAY